MLLKKIAMTSRENTSLWIVMARRLVNIKVQRGIINPLEVPSLYTHSKKIRMLEETMMRRNAEDIKSMTD